MEYQDFEKEYVKRRKIESLQKKAYAAAVLKIATILLVFLTMFILFVGFMTTHEIVAHSAVNTRYGYGYENVLGDIGYNFAFGVGFKAFFTWLGFFVATLPIAIASFILHCIVVSDYAKYKNKKKFTSLLLIHGFLIQIIAIVGLFAVEAEFKEQINIRMKENKDANSDIINKDKTGDNQQNEIFVAPTKNKGDKSTFSLILATGILKIIATILPIINIVALIFAGVANFGHGIYPFIRSLLKGSVVVVVLNSLFDLECLGFQFLLCI